MQDPSRTEQRLIEENALLKQRIQGLERSAGERQQAAIAARHAMDAYRALADHSPDPVDRFDRAGRHVYINRAAAALVGKAPDEVVGRTNREIGVADAVAAIWDERVRQVFETGGPLEVEDVFPTAHGMRFFQVRLTPERSSDGAVETVLAVSRDTTERRRAEDALRHSERRYRLLIEETTADGFCELGPDWRIRSANAPLEKMLGYASGELVGLDVAEDLANPEDRATLRERLLSRGQGASRRDEHRLRRADGKSLWVSIAASPIRDDEGSVVGAFAMLTDITERARAEEALRESETSLRAVVESSPVALAINDEHGNITFVNRRFVETFGYTLDDIPTVDAWWPRAYPDPGYRQRVAREWQDAVEKSHRESAILDLPDYEVTAKDGSVRTVRFSVAPMGTSHVVILYDVTDHKRAEEERARLKAQLDQAQKLESVGRLAGGVAHDFNNMLGVILGHAELVMDRLDPGSPLQAELSEIHAAAQRSADLTRQLLAFARKQTVALTVLDVGQAVSRTAAVLRRLIGENIQMCVRQEEDACRVRLDPTQFDQILTNLCLNARDAIRHIGRITLETANCVLDDQRCAGHEGCQPGEYVRIMVADDGCGMDEETLSHIFEPFFTTKGVGHGVGLGLASVYGAVKQNGGFIDVRSTRGSGTTFTIYLPRTREQAEPSGTEGSAGPVRLGHATVLIVEDEPSLLKLARTALERSGYDVLTANTPGEAIRLADAHAGRIHLLVSDVVMPEMDGRTLAKRVLSSNPHAKCLFMSGYTADVITDHGVVDDGVPFIQKPFSIKELAAKVRETLDRE